MPPSLAMTDQKSMAAARWGWAIEAPASDRNKTSLSIFRLLAKSTIAHDELSTHVVDDCHGRIAELQQYFWQHLLAILAEDIVDEHLQRPACQGAAIFAAMSVRPR